MDEKQISYLKSQRIILNVGLTLAALKKTVLTTPELDSQFEKHYLDLRQMMCLEFSEASHQPLSEIEPFFPLPGDALLKP